MILALSTASEKVTIALYLPKKIEKEIAFDSYRTQSREILPEIEKLFRTEMIEIKDITHICVHQGPGSYTGLRVGISIANTLGWSLNIPIIGIKSIDTNQINAISIAKKAWKLKSKYRKFKKVMPYYQKDAKLF